MSAAGAGAPATGGPDAPPEASAAPSYGRSARILSIGIATTGVLTFAYFSVASHVLDDKDELGAINLLWTVLFIAMSVFYRPVEQYLSRTIASTGGHPFRTAGTLQVIFAAVFLVGLFAARPTLEDRFESSALFWVLVVAAVAYAVSYFARGVLAGNRWFGLYGGLVFFEAAARLCFPLAVAIGVASGETAVALGICAAPLASMVVIPLALRRRRPTPGAARPSVAVESATSFALAVSAVQVGEQTLLNAAVLLVPAGSTVAVVFAAFLITRTPLQLFQSVQTSLLPHLAGLRRGDRDFDHAIRRTLLGVGAFGAAVVLALLAVGPPVMSVVIDVDEDWARLGLATIGLGMTLHLAAGTLTQAGYAMGRARAVAGVWLAAAAAFVAWMLAAAVDDPLTRAEAGYAGAAALLLAGVAAVVRRP